MHQVSSSAARRRAVFWLTLPLAGLLAGCGGETIVPVEGRITVGGAPAGPGTIIFQPADAARPAASGEIDAQGHYTLTTRKPGDGAVAGQHRVIIQQAAAGGPETAADESASHIPLRYADPQASGLTADVVPAGAAIDFNLPAP